MLLILGNDMYKTQCTCLPGMEEINVNDILTNFYQNIFYYNFFAFRGTEIPIEIWI